MELYHRPTCIRAARSRVGVLSRSPVCRLENPRVLESTRGAASGQIGPGDSIPQRKHPRATV